LAGCALTVSTRNYFLAEKWGMTANVQGDGGGIYILPSERQPIKEQKYRICTKVHQRIFSPELLMNSEQKADVYSFSQPIVKPNAVLL